MLLSDSAASIASFINTSRREPAHRFGDILRRARINAVLYHSNQSKPSSEASGLAGVESNEIQSVGPTAAGYKTFCPRFEGLVFPETLGRAGPIL